MESKDIYKAWLDSDYIDDESREELRSIGNDPAEIEDRFYKDLEFGTAGLRGLIGAGTNRMNVYTVRKATQGLAFYLLGRSKYTASGGVVIAYDSRHGSYVFASEAAAVLNGNGIKVYFFNELKPVPELSFAVRELKASAGICITASHNPKEYNGYKVYGPDGGQLSTEASAEVQKNISGISDLRTVRITGQSEASACGLFHVIGPEIDNRYMEKLKSLRVSPGIAETAKSIGAGVSIIYTPLYGTGNRPVRRILSETGFDSVFVVPEQEEPDPSFPEVRYPNPEEISVFDLALKYAKKSGASLILGTDPDCDRIGVIAAGRNGCYRMLTGNQTGYLLMEYIFSRLKEEGILPGNAFAIVSIVTGKMAAEIAGAYGVKLIEVYTGFKFFAEKIKELDESESGSYKYIFGFEESFGYLAGDFVRDKDAVCAAMLIAEMTAWYASKGLTLHDALEEMFGRYGWHSEITKSINISGKRGAEIIRRAMGVMRERRIREFGSIRIKTARDFKEGVQYEYSLTDSDPCGAVTTVLLDYTKSDVLHYMMYDGSWFAIRPSGTEPKIKFYFGVRSYSGADAEIKLEKLKKCILDYMKPLFDETGT